jgi:hypothetical protein
MYLVATLVGKSKYAKKILQSVPENSVVLLPESVSLIGDFVKKISTDRGLFIIYNSDTVENGKKYIAMRGVDNGEEVWQVRKFKLWPTDIENGFSASRAEPIVKIRDKIAALFICYDMVTIGRDNRLFAMGRVLQKYKPEVLLLPANWFFNFELVDNIIDTAMNNISSLKVCLFSCTNTVGIVKTRGKKVKFDSFGWEGVEIR